MPTVAVSACCSLKPRFPYDIIERFVAPEQVSITLIGKG